MNTAKDDGMLAAQDGRAARIRGEQRAYDGASVNRAISCGCVVIARISGGLRVVVAALVVGGNETTGYDVTRQRTARTQSA